MKRLLCCLWLLPGLLFWAHRAVAVEEPQHSVVLHEGAFELRDYPARVVAEVEVTGTQFQAGNAGFRLLAGYIFGGNADRQHIAMSAPVSQFRPGAGGAGQPGAQRWTVQFFMPSGTARAALPLPNDARVKLVELPAQRVAVLRYSGWSTAAGFARHAAALLAACAQHQLRASGPIELAQYDPPWTLWFLRRNEVMVAVAR